MKKRKIEKEMKNEEKKEFKIATRGRTFQGYVIKKFSNRAVVFFERLFYVPKYERYEKRKSLFHAKLPSQLKDVVNVGDLIEIKECRPISKMIHFIVTKKIRGRNESSSSQN